MYLAPDLPEIIEDGPAVGTLAPHPKDARRELYQHPLSVAVLPEELLQNRFHRGSRSGV
ncbi:MAG: hypothetical protein ABI334_08810 [Candidatus Dormiibacterota bacterium]